ncbi:MAG TPA: hypothetical protein VFZ55_07720 [Nitrososphaera sp.]
MTYKISRCIICGQFFQSKKQLKHHKDRDHRITNSKMKTIISEKQPSLLPKVLTNNIIES